MTAQKKIAPTLKQQVDDLIAQGHAPVILSMYVELMGEAMRLQECLKAEHPQVLQAVAGLMPQQPVVQQTVMSQAPGSSWNPLMGGVPTIPPPMTQPGLQEPFGTIHSEVPATYEYPMPGDTNQYPMDNAGLGYQQAVMKALATAAAPQGGVPVGYETLDPQEGAL